MSARWFLAIVCSLSIAGVAGFAGAGELVVAEASVRDQAKAKKKEGDSLRKGRKNKEAETAYRAAIKLDPEWYKSYEALGNLQFAAKKYDDAIATFMKAVEVEPRYHTGLYNIAFAYRKSRKYDKAVEFYKKYIDEKANDPDAYYGMASAYESMGKKKEAIDSYLKYAEMEKRPSEKKYVLKARDKAELLRKQLGASAVAAKPVDKPAAKPADKPADKPVAKPADKPVAKPADKPAADDQKAKVAGWIAQGDKAMAAKAYTKAMKFYFDAARAAPRNTDAVYKLGLVYEKTGNSKAAELKWKMVLKVDAEHADAKAALERLANKGKEPKPADKPVVKPADKPVAKPADKPVAKPADKPVIKPADKPVVKPAVKPKVAQKPADGLTSDQRKAADLLKKGDEQFKQRSFSGAIASYTHATQLDSKNEQALFKLATAYAYAGNLKVAVYKWKQVLKINPKNEAALNNIEKAEAKLSGKEPPKKADAPKAPPAKVKKPNAKQKKFDKLLAEATAAKKRGDAKGVLAAATRALKLKSDASVAILRGEALVFLKRYAEAKKAFSRAMVIDPNLAAPFYGLGEASRLAGEKDRARYYFKMYVQSKASDVKPKLAKRAQDFLKKK